MNIFLSEGFGEKCKHTELALNFIQKQYFSLKKSIFPSLQSNSDTVDQQKFVFEISFFKGTMRPKQRNELEKRFSDLKRLHSIATAQRILL